MIDTETATVRGVIEFPIVTERLLLRPFTLEDAAAIATVYGDPEVMRHVGEGTAAGDWRTAKMLEEYIAHQERHGFSFWAVVERAGGQLIGHAGLYHGEDGSPEIELGYTLGRAWWGRGYATEAAAACRDVAFERLALETVTAIADPANARFGPRSREGRHAPRRPPDRLRSWASGVPARTLGLIRPRDAAPRFSTS